MHQTREQFFEQGSIYGHRKRHLTAAWCIVKVISDTKRNSFELKIYLHRYETTEMKDKKRDDGFCDCISYGKFEPKKFERLQKNRKRQMCVWRDVGPFSERQEELSAARARFANTINKPLFPPICGLPCITNYDTYKAMYNTGNNAELMVDELRALGDDNRVNGCERSALKDCNVEEDKTGLAKSEVKGSKNSAEPESSRLKLPKLTNFSIVNQRL